MAADADSRWVLAVRLLVVLSAVLLAVAIVEARALRAARAELQQLRAACPQSVFP
jgi:hypothetical protein